MKKVGRSNAQGRAVRKQLPEASVENPGRQPSNANVQPNQFAMLSEALRTVSGVILADVPTIMQTCGACNSYAKVS